MKQSSSISRGAHQLPEMPEMTQRAAQTLEQFGALVRIALELDASSKGALESESQSSPLVAEWGGLIRLPVRARATTVEAGKTKEGCLPTALTTTTRMARRQGQSW
jgi:hypothetical protein